MRKKLRTLTNNSRHTFTGEFNRKGTKTAYKGPPLETILLRNIRLADSDELMTDHLWFNFGKQFKELGSLREGDIIQFDARVGTYRRKYKDEFTRYYHEGPVEYKLERPTKLAKLGEFDEVGVVNFK